MSGELGAILALLGVSFAFLYLTKENDDEENIIYGARLLGYAGAYIGIMLSVFISMAFLVAGSAEQKVMEYFFILMLVGGLFVLGLSGINWMKDFFLSLFGLKKDLEKNKYKKDA